MCCVLRGGGDTKPRRMVLITLRQMKGFASSNADLGNKVNKSHVPGPSAQKTELNSTQTAALSLLAAGKVEH